MFIFKNLLSTYTCIICFIIFSIFKSGVVLSADNVESLGKIEVTGSHIKRTDTEGPSPVLVIDREAIEQSGLSTASELLRSLTQNAGVSFDDKYVGSFAPGSSGISLRGLGQNTALVLIDGRRVASYGFAQELKDNFVDLNSIPLAAIERIEVLKDGASAIYGSDAIAGVVNIIMRKEYEGSDVTVTTGQSSEGDAEESRLSVVSGFASSDHSLSFAFDYFKRNPVLRGAREFSKTADHTAVGGQDFTSIAYPVANVYGLITDDFIAINGFYDFNPEVSLIPESERTGVMLNYNRELSADINLFAQMMINRTVSGIQQAATPVFDDVFVSDTQAFNTYGEPVLTFWRMDEMGNRLLETTTDASRVVLGLDGVSADWDWNAAINYSDSKSQMIGKNFVSITALQTAIDTDQINPFGTSANSQAALDSVRATISRDGEFTFYGVDAKATTELNEFITGTDPVGVAVGMQQRHEKLSDVPDALSANYDIVGLGATTTSGDRDVSSLFTEFNIPLAADSKVELQVAARYENYSDFGAAANPKLAIRYQPLENLVVRSSWGTGFRAPSLSELYLGDTRGLEQVVDTTRCTAVALDCSPQAVFTNTSGNPDLKEEESESFYLGFVIEPVTDFSVSIDYWNYKHTNVVSLYDAQYLIDNEALFPGVINRGPVAGADPGALDWSNAIDGTFFNISEQNTDGIDLEVKYDWKTAIGSFTLKHELTYLLSFERAPLPGSSPEDLLGSYRFPDLRTKTTLSWNNASYSALLSANYIGAYEDKLDPAIEVGSYQTFDTQITYKGFKSSKLILGINNLTDEAPPFANEEEGYDYATHDPRGRYVYITYNVSF
ncbi:MAG: TonB-dependent receptor [Gammaproteobacteria bacterium]|nr:TonB-dependent receptor [Gammaproteobacteria bacterium]